MPGRHFKTMMPICGKRLRPLVPFLVEAMGAARPSPRWAGGDSAPLTDAHILRHYVIPNRLDALSTQSTSCA
jgi:hypothetical protein